jgi:hypothetical protein
MPATGKIDAKQLNVIGKLNAIFTNFEQIVCKNVIPNFWACCTQFFYCQSKNWLSNFKLAKKWFYKSGRELLFVRNKKEVAGKLALFNFSFKRRCVAFQMTF